MPLASLVAGSLGWGSRGGRSLVRSAPFGSAQFWPYSWQVLASARPPGFLGAVHQLSPIWPYSSLVRPVGLRLAPRTSLSEVSAGAVLAV